MKKFEILPHIADFKIKSFGKTKEELFLNSLLAMIEGFKPEMEKPESKIERKVKIKSPDFTALLVDFLNEVLYLAQTEKAIFKNIKFEKFSETELKAQLFGQKVKRFNEDIKAVTYHNLDIHQKEDGSWEATVLFDI